MDGYDSFCCFRSDTDDHYRRVLFEVTTKCNLKCSFCHSNNEQQDGLPFDQLLKKLIVLRDYGITGVIFSGGEPLLRNDILNIIRSAKNIGYDVDLCTNATLVTKSLAFALKELLSEVSVSLDSADYQVHDYLRGIDGAWEKTTIGIKNLSLANIKIHSITIVNEITFPNLIGTVKMLERLGVESITLLGEMQIKENSVNSKYLKDNYLMKSKLTDIRNAVNIPVNTKRLIFNPTTQKCEAGRKIFGLTVDGKLVPCIILKRFYEKKSTIDWQLMLAKDRNNKCSLCNDISKCSGGCPGALVLLGKSPGIDVLCKSIR